MVFKLALELMPGFQVIITEHADINEDWYQDAIRELGIVKLQSMGILFESVVPNRRFT